MAVFCFLVVAFYVFLGLFLGNRVAEITVTSIFSFVVMAQTLVYFLSTFCDSIDLIISFTMIPGIRGDLLVRKMHRHRSY